MLNIWRIKLTINLLGLNKCVKINFMCNIKHCFWVCLWVCLWIRLAYELVDLGRADFSAQCELESGKPLDTWVAGTVLIFLVLWLPDLDEIMIPAFLCLQLKYAHREIFGCHNGMTQLNAVFPSAYTGFSKSSWNMCSMNKCTHILFFFGKMR